MGKNNWTFDDLAKKTKLPNNPALAAIEREKKRIKKEKKAKEPQLPKDFNPNKIDRAGMITVNHKPASVNDVFKGRRFRNDYYNDYEKAIKKQLPELTLPEPPYSISFVFGLSSKLADLDNPCKPILDIISKRYGFNDKLVFELHIRKELVETGQEYISFEIKKANN